MLDVSSSNARLFSRVRVVGGRDRVQYPVVSEDRAGTAHEPRRLQHSSG